MANKPIFIRNVVKAAHLLLTGYGHWLPNDLRESGSEEIRKLGLEMLGPIHFGRKWKQPSAFYVIEHYIDPSYKFPGLIDFGRYTFQRHRKIR